MKVKKGGIHRLTVNEDIFIALEKARQKLKLKTRAETIRYFLIDFGYLKE